MFHWWGAKECLVELTVLPGFNSAFYGCFQMALALSHPDWTHGMAALEAGDVLSPCCWPSQVRLGGCKWPAGPPWGLQGKGQHRPLAVFLINPPLRKGGGEGVLQSQGGLCSYSSTTCWDSLTSTAHPRTSLWECFLLHSTYIHVEDVEGNSWSSNKSCPKLTAWVWVNLCDSPILAWWMWLFSVFLLLFPLPLFPLQEREIMCIHLTGQRVAKENSRQWRSVWSLALEIKHEELLL